MHSFLERFRGFFPVVIDVETGGFDAETNPLLELAAVTLKFEDDQLVCDEDFHAHVEPEPGLVIDPKALAFTGIDPDHPFRMAKPEKTALQDMFQFIRSQKKPHNCQRAVLVGHNSWFDLSFVNAGIKRHQLKRSPLHAFTSFDTASLAGLAYGQTVLAKACAAAGIDFDNSEAHSAIYDARKTAALFCQIVNTWQALGGWPPPIADAK